jgi:hypothetical protein
MYKNLFPIPENSNFFTHFLFLFRSNFLRTKLIIYFSFLESKEKLISSALCLMQIYVVISNTVHSVMNYWIHKEEIWFTKFTLDRKCKLIKTLTYVIFEDLIAVIRLLPYSYLLLTLCFLPWRWRQLFFWIFRKFLLNYSALQPRRSLFL